MHWKNLYRGFLMGVSDLVPGVSGGTIAVLLGIYQQLIDSISGLFTREWKKHLQFLLPLGIGVTLAILILSKVMKWLLNHYEMATFYFFLGLIIGVLPYLFRESNIKQLFKWYHYLFLLSGIGIILLIGIGTEKTEIITDRSLLTYGYLFLSGVIASAAMILPGISGSFVLLILGVYYTAIDAVDHLEISVILVMGIGIFIGVISISKIIKFFLNHYRTATFAMVIGLVIGSVFVIFPGWAVNFSQMLLFVIVFSVGLFVAYILGKVEY